MNACRSFRLPAALLALGLLAGLAHAQPDPRATQNAAEIELRRKLAKAIDLTLDNVELQKAFETIAAKAEITLTVDPASYDCLPYGATTKVTASFRSATVQASIDEMLSHLGLEMTLSGANVIIRPTAPLLYIGRRAEWNELLLLEQLRKTQLPKIDVDWTADLRTLLGHPDLLVKIAAMSAHDKAMAEVKSHLPCSVMNALDIYAAASKQVWTVNAGNILVLPLKDWINRQLERPLVLHADNRPLQEVVDDLAYLSRVRFEPEPGLYAAFPMVTLHSQDSLVIKALDALAGSTFIAYEIRDDRVYLYLAKKTAASPVPPGSPIVGRISVPLGHDGLSLDMFVRESDLPPDVAALCRKRLADTVEALRQSLQEKPPATTPGK